MTDIQALNAATAVSPYPAYNMRSEAVPMLTGCIHDETGMLAATASVVQRNHPDDRLGDYMLGGMVSVLPVKVAARRRLARRGRNALGLVVRFEGAHIGRMTKQKWTGSMWNQRYDREDYLFGTEPAQFLVNQRGLLQAGQSAFVIADGEGRNSVWLAQQGLQVTALDSAETGLAKARALAKARDTSLSILLADLRTWDWQENAFDVVVAVFIQFADPAFRAAIFDGMKRTVKPGGRILLHGFTPEQMQNTSGGPRIEAHLYTPEMLAEAFEGFEIERLETYTADLTEGPGHDGPAALIDLVARKPL